MTLSVPCPSQITYGMLEEQSLQASNPICQVMITSWKNTNVMASRKTQLHQAQMESKHAFLFTLPVQKHCSTEFVKHGVYICCVDGFVGYSCSYKACVSPTINSLHAGSLNIGLRGTISLHGKHNNRLVKQNSLFTAKLTSLVNVRGKPLYIKK